MAFDTFSHRGEIKRFLKEQGNQESVRRELEQLYNSTAPVHGVRIGDKYTILEHKFGFQILKNSDIVWVYHSNMKTKLYGVVTTGSFHRVTFRTADGGEYQIPVLAAKTADELVKYLFPRLPQALFGYNSQIVQVWNEGMKAQNGHASMRLLGAMQHQKAQ